MAEPGSHRFEVVSTEDIHVGAILALRLDEVAMPGGGTARREVVETLGAVAIAALDEQGRVVLIRQYRHPLATRMWELPAGLIDRAGEDPLETAKRELAEEVGLAAADWSVLVDQAVSPGFTDHAIRIYLATGLSTADRPAPEDEEADLVVRRVPLSEAVQLVLAGEIINGIAVSGLLAAQAVRAGVVEPRPPDVPWPSCPTRFALRSD
jgi:ADP-ribose pyrophosphatase